jgi:hypothetical protein
MSERTRIAAKTTESKKENSVPQQRKTELSQPMRSPADQILFLQRTAGNQAVQRLLKSGALQAKLRIGAPGDIYEQEADRVAEQVVSSTSIQRKCASCNDGEEKKGVQRKVENTSATASVPDSFIQNLGEGQSLDPATRAFMEPRFGQEFSGVRVHTDAKAAEAARAVDARAFTMGRDVVFGEGNYAPQSVSGRQLLAHELAHVVQNDLAPSPSVVRLKPDTQSDKAAYDSYFTQSNKKYFSNLIMALANFNRKGRMDGQPPQYQSWRSGGKWIATEKNPLKQELLDWHENANNIIIDNFINFIEAVVHSISNELFSSVPGPALTTEVTIEVVQTAIMSYLHKTLGEAGPIIEGVANIIKAIIFDAMREKDMESRKERLESALQASGQLRHAILSDLYNLTTVFSYYQSWLDLSEPSELSQFRIPFSPEIVTESEVEGMISRSLQEARSGIQLRPTEGLDNIGLFYFLTSNGIIADNPELEKALSGKAGLAMINKTEVFPTSHFISPYIRTENGPYKGDRIWIYVWPLVHRAGYVAGNQAPELGQNPGIVLLYDRTGSRASYDISNRKWVT